MDLVAKTLAPVRRAAHQFFNCHVRLSVQGGLRVQLVEREKPAPGLTAEQFERKRQRAEVKLMAVQLRETLDAVPDARASSRHLAFIEQTLMQEGLRALETVPLDVLRKALDQFEILVTNWSPEGLAGLRSRIAVAIQERDQDDRPTEAQSYNR